MSFQHRVIDQIERGIELLSRHVRRKFVTQAGDFWSGHTISILLTCVLRVHFAKKPCSESGCALRDNMFHSLCSASSSAPHRGSLLILVMAFGAFLPSLQDYALSGCSRMFEHLKLPFGCVENFLCEVQNEYGLALCLGCN